MWNRSLAWSGLVWIGAALLIAAGLSYLVALRHLTALEEARAKSRAQLYRGTLVAALDRFQHLPFILSGDPFIRGALDGGDAAAVNERLESFAVASGLEAIYLMNRVGETIAASNHRESMSFIGHNYGFRPYFQTAIAGARGEFFAIGATTARPGYFVAEPVGPRDAPLGVVAVKLRLGGLQEDWRRGGEDVFVANRDGIVVLASNPAWLYSALEEISPARRREIRSERQFGEAPLAPLDWRAGPGEATLSGRDYIHARASVGRLGWRIHYLSERGALHGRAVLIGVAGAALALVAMSLMLYLRTERLRSALEVSQRQRQAFARGQSGDRPHIEARRARSALGVPWPMSSASRSAPCATT